MVFHLLLGFLLLFGPFAKFYALLIIPFGIYSIVRLKNSGEQAALFCAYLAGSDVLFRMAGAMLLHEMHKYGIIFLVCTAMWVENRRNHISPIYLMYILLLLVGITFSEIPFPESIRKNLLFNLSGPLSLGFAAIYFYKRTITLDKLLDIIFCLGLPVIAMISLLYFRTPSIEEIRFGGGANFEASGGFGPNQVSTILGVGAFIIVAHFLAKKKFSGYLLFDLLLLTYIFYRNLLTFSRGGFITAILAILFFGCFFIYGRNDRIKSLVKYLSIGVFLMSAIWLYTTDVTEGMIENRYTNKNARGQVKQDVTTGRADIFSSELNGLFENPIFGMGVGSGKFRRLDETGLIIASHNEVSRLLGEHGMLGIIILLILFLTPIGNAIKQPAYAKAFLGAFFIFWFLTINHSAMRVSFPGFIYALSLITITLKKPIELP